VEGFGGPIGSGDEQTEGVWDAVVVEATDHDEEGAWEKEARLKRNLCFKSRIDSSRDISGEGTGRWENK